jgi:hypothetical protein
MNIVCRALTVADLGGLFPFSFSLGVTPIETRSSWSAHSGERHSHSVIAHPDCPGAGPDSACNLERGSEAPFWWRSSLVISCIYASSKRKPGLGWNTSSLMGVDALSRCVSAVYEELVGPDTCMAIMLAHKAARRKDEKTCLLLLSQPQMEYARIKPRGLDSVESRGRAEESGSLSPHTPFGRGRARSTTLARSCLGVTAQIHRWIAMDRPGLGAVLWAGVDARRL